MNQEAQAAAPKLPRIIDVASQLLAEFPALASAQQPKRSVLPLALLDGPGLVESNPAREGRWLGPVLSEGDCLSPLVPAGRHTWQIDPQQEPQDRDLVLVHAGDLTMRTLIAISAEDELWLAKYSSLPNTWLKQFRLVDGLPLLVERGGAMTMTDDIRLLGVATYAR